MKKLLFLIVFLPLFFFTASPALAITCSTQNPCWLSKSPMPTDRRDLGVASDISGKVYAAGGYNGGFLGTLEAYDPTTDTWTTKTSAPIARNDMGFAFNPSNGKFYFGGGYNEGIHSEFYEYDPTNDTWTAKTSLPTASVGLRFAVANGKVYSIGGGFLNGSYESNLYEYDPAIDAWTTKSVIPHPAGEMGVVTAPNGKVYAIGGGDGSFVDEYDPVTDTWEAKTSLPTPRGDMGVSLDTNGNIVVAGGAGNDGYSNVVEEYNPTTDTWTTKTPLPFPVYAMGMALGGDGNAYALGGQTINWTSLRSNHAYTSTTPTTSCSGQNPCWTQKTSMSTARRDLGVASGANGHIYAAGGFNNAGLSSAGFTNILEEYDPTSETWTTQSPVPVERNDMGFAFNPTNGKFYFGGGYNEGLHDEFYEYDPINDAWIQKASMPTASAGLRFAAANGKIYAIGGGFLNGSYVSNVEEYNPTNDTWTVKSPIPHPSGGMGLVTAPNEKIYAIGGGDGSFVDEYNPVTDTWTAKTSLSTPRGDMGASLGSNGNIYAVGGAANTGYTNAVEEYNPTTDTWTPRTGLPMPIYAVGLALGGDGNIYAIGGQAVGDPVLNTNYAGFISVTITPTPTSIPVPTATPTPTVTPTPTATPTPTPSITTLTPSTDSYIKQGSQNENEGASTFLRLQQSGYNRALLKFDESQIQTAVNSSSSFSAKLQLTITDNGNNWGTSGRSIELHRLTQNWIEGNGFIYGNNPSDRGTGSGTTWNCATDSNIHNQASNCNGLTSWNMTTSSLWPFVSIPTASTTINNNQSGIVEFDVTSDVQSFLSGSNQNYGWLIKKTDEGQSGRVEFGSRESANGAKLIINPN